MSSQRIIKCTVCPQKLAIPDDKKILIVTCKKCKAKFLWELGNDNDPKLKNLGVTDFHRVLNGVCDGRKRFKIVFSKQRSDPYYRFLRNEPIHAYKFYDEFDDINVEKEESFSGREFYFSYDCYHCHSKEQYVYCNGCNHFICGSQRFSDKKGNKYVGCPNCKKCSPIVTTACSYLGSTSDLRNQKKKKDQIQTPEKQKLTPATASSHFRALPPKK